MYKLASGAPFLVRRSELPQDVRALLVGGDGSEVVLHALYDHVLDEAVPPRLIETLLRNRMSRPRMAIGS
jgi:hypothetical protein